MWWTDDGRRAAYTLKDLNASGLKLFLADDPTLARAVIEALRPPSIQQHPDGWFHTPGALLDALRGGLPGLEHLSYELVASDDGVPWSLPAHDRLVHRYGMHVVLARKRP